ncbi:MAG: FeoA family protein [Bacillota bacterium]|jgi:Fe2+ transport system protein FeoA
MPMRGRVVTTLAAMRPGETGEIVAVESPDQAGCRRLFALGLVPGAAVALVQAFPSFVFTVGRTTVAVDAETARIIKVLLLSRPRSPRPGFRQTSSPRPRSRET